MERSAIKYWPSAARVSGRLLPNSGIVRRRLCGCCGNRWSGPVHRRRRSSGCVWRADRQWLRRPAVVRMLELAREDPVQPYRGSRSRFGEVVQRLRQDLTQEQAYAMCRSASKGCW